ADTYLTADGRYLTIMVLNDTAWEPFCRALEKPEWLANENFRTSSGRVRHKDELNALVAAEFRKRPGSAWAERLEAHRIPYGFVYDYLEAVEDPQVKHRGLVKELQHPTSGTIRVIGPPWKSDEPHELFPPPLLGQHTAEVLMDWLGLDEREARRIHAAQDDKRHRARL